ncbi:probably inactive leucine-rich repeat receptor-like protein kinase At5g48380 [Abrus precatorius]|uniref:Probably inactive leucine-rich repeat receptor-like protein kinase At5g48380 n=1 Tax=Abrus precatorius TaxID=3816 RepID=A0A8B8KYE5_ABRPR|nr:probably inactive leucine-rich repeat receptor-like protein kinase At5g48380 [Abrus precatorius]
MSNAGSIELYGGTQETADNSLFDRSFWYTFAFGYVFSATWVTIALMYFCVPWAQQKKSNASFTSSNAGRSKKIHDANQVPNLLPLSLLRKGNPVLVSRALDKLISSVSFTELCEATDYFNMINVIGMGKTGMMYKAKLVNAPLVAVKRLYDSQLFETKFAKEIMILGRFKHRNIVGLLGFCTERKQRILVYEFMTNGKLSDCLYPLQNEAFPLEWPIRLKIALGLSRVLSGLHHSCNWQILHQGISSEHVLLDQNFEPKLSNFTNAKFIKGNNNKLAKKDVYDFGIVLLQLITGNKCIQMNGFCNVIDESLLGKGFDEEISCLVKIAIDCIQMSPQMRPTMLDVYKNIKRLWEGYGSDD